MTNAQIPMTNKITNPDYKNLVIGHWDLGFLLTGIFSQYHQYIRFRLVF